MKNTGFRIDSKRLERKLAKAKEQILAEAFKPDLLDYARKVLNRCVTTTPARDLSRIQEAQGKQYENRVNFIPSNHHKTDPWLVSKGTADWLYCGGKWYNCAWRLPSAVQGAYQMLFAERQRRLQTPRTKFIADRAKARGLYKRSWAQVGDSIGIAMRASGIAQNSLTRRKPAHEPPKGYAQIRGGKRVLNIVVFNPFLNAEYGPLTAVYKPFTAQSIIDPAMAAHRAAYERALQKRLQGLLGAIMNR